MPVLDAFMAVTLSMTVFSAIWFIHFDKKILYAVLTFVTNASSRPS